MNVRYPWCFCLLVAGVCANPFAAFATQAPFRNYEPGQAGGELVIAERAELKTFNPVLALDAPSRDIIWRTMADLISINRQTMQCEPALAESWKSSPDGLHYTLTLRHGLLFSDGQPFTADDVIFSFHVYLDEKIASSQRDLLIIGGKPISPVRLDDRTVRFDFASPYAAAERIFDSVAILPRHVLQAAYEQGRFRDAWGLAADPTTVVGLGPFRLKEYHPGSAVVLERNPYFWKADAAAHKLPYLDRVRFIFVSGEEAQVLRFASGETDILNRFNARYLGLLTTQSVIDLGPSLDYTFLFFNLGPGGNPWFKNLSFREAVSSLVDREAIVRLVYSGRATPLWTHVPPGNRLWADQDIPKPARSVERARSLLAASGFKWDSKGQLLDASGTPVVFSLVTSAGNQEREQIAGLVAEDLRQAGMDVRVTPLEFRSLIDRVLHTRQYDACILSLGGGDADPNSEMNVWLSSGQTHVWNPSQKTPATTWEADLDDLMRRQMITLDHAKRKKLFDRVQEIEAAQLPLISLVSPHVLVAAKPQLANLRPAVLDHNTLWNAEFLFWQDRARR